MDAGIVLYARYLYASQRYEEAEELFHDIRSAKAIQWDSLELKSAYLEAQCLMKREKYLLAGRVLKNIHDSLLRAGTKRLSERRHEIRKKPDDKSADQVWDKKWHDVDQEHQMKI